MKELSMEEKAKAYDEALKKLRSLHDDYDTVSTLIDIKKELEYIFPELKEPEDDRYKRILHSITNKISLHLCDIFTEEEYQCFDAWSNAWLEKQEVTDEEIIFRPVVGTDIRMAAKQALEKIDIGKKVVLAFNGAYILVNGKTVGEIDSEYDAWLKKQGKSKFEQSIQDGDNVVTNEDGTHFNVSQLERVAKKATETEETAKEFLKSAKIMDENDELADEYRHEKQGEQEEPQVYETEDGEVITYSESEGYKVVEPKFKEGDWIIFNGLTLYVREVVKGFYRTISIDGITNSYDWSIDNAARLWTIQDAKDGDVLATPNYIYIFNSIYKEIETVAFYCLMKKSDEHFSFGDYRIHDEILNSIPATKEQRDLLFQKMKEAGFGWNAEKKELKKIEAITHLFNVGDTITKKRNSDINDFGQFTITDITGGKYWYNDRIICDITEQDKWEIYESVRKNPWGEEDENMLKSIIATCELAELDRDSSPARHLFEMQANWLKSLKERIKGGH